MTTNRLAKLRERYEKLRSQHGLNFIMVLSADEARVLLDIAEEAEPLQRMSIDSGAVLNKAFDFIRDLRYGYTLLGSAKGWDMTKDATIQKVDAFFAEHKRPVE